LCFLIYTKGAIEKISKRGGLTSRSRAPDGNLQSAPSGTQDQAGSSVWYNSTHETSSTVGPSESCPSLLTTDSSGSVSSHGMNAASPAPSVSGTNSGAASRHTDGESSDDESTKRFTPDSTNKSAESNDKIVENLKLGELHHMLLLYKKLYFIIFIECYSLASYACKIDHFQLSKCSEHT